MEISINQQKKQFTEAPANLAILLEKEFPDLKGGIAVALNNRVVPKDQWSNTTLQAEDQILIIKATQGG